MINNNEDIPDKLLAILKEDIFVQIVNMNKNNSINEDIITDLDSVLFMKRDERNERLKEIISSQQVDDKADDSDNSEVKYI